MFLFTNHIQNHSNMVKWKLGQAEIPAAGLPMIYGPDCMTVTLVTHYAQRRPKV